MLPSPNLQCDQCQALFHYREKACPQCGALPSEREQEVTQFGYQTAVIRQLCTQYEHIPACFYEETIPARKRRNAQKHFPIEDSEKVILLVDATVFGSNKQGFAVGEFGLYWRNSWTTPSTRTYLSWDEFAKRPLSIDDGVIQLGRGDTIDLVVLPEEERNQFLKLLQEIQEAIS